MKRKYFIFDLDDTLAYEIDYLKSAYREIAHSLGSGGLYDKMVASYQNGEDVFSWVANEHNVEKASLFSSYRSHFPTLRLNEGAEEIMLEIKKRGHLLGLITDGRAVTQRNKLKALGLLEKFDKLLISEEFGSEKPDIRNFKAFEQQHIIQYIYIADNVKKDFITPNKLGWTTVCLLDAGNNIHPQSFDYPAENLPTLKISKLSQLRDFL